MPEPVVHPTALVGPQVTLGRGVVVGPFSVLEGNISFADGVQVGPHCHFMGTLEVGPRTNFAAGCVIGGRPQHTGYKGEPTRTKIGSDNDFREHVTVHRAMPTAAATTVIGDRNLFMAGAHVAHDGVVADDCIFANGALLGGHATVGHRAFLSGNCAVHQHCRVGKLALLGGTSAISQDLCPFWIAQGGINMLHGVNVVGMRRAGMSRDEIRAARDAYKLLNRSGLTIPEALEQMEALYPDSDSVREIVEFARSTKRGICTGHQGHAEGDGAGAG